MKLGLYPISTAMAAALALLLMNNGNPPTVTTSGVVPTQDTAHRGQGMGMMGPHHALLMAYRESMGAFARALHRDVTHSKRVDSSLAHPAVAEMRRNFDEMDKRHDAHLASMNDSTRAKMAAMIGHVETHISQLNKHLTELEAALEASEPDTAVVLEHSSQIVKHCDGMMKMPMMKMQGKKNRS